MTGTWDTYIKWIFFKGENYQKIVTTKFRGQQLENVNLHLFGRVWVSWTGLSSFSLIPWHAIVKEAPREEEVVGAATNTTLEVVIQPASDHEYSGCDTCTI